MSAVSLAPHQLKALREMKIGCILKGGVGSGKSRTSLAYYINACGGRFRFNDIGEFRKMDRPRDLYIFTTAKKRDDGDWIKEAAPFGLTQSADTSMYGTKIVIDSWNNLPNYTDVEGAFIILDEQRVVGSGAWTKAFLQLAKRNMWILLSATPGDVWMDYLPVFLANGFYKNKTEFIRQHVVFSRFSKFPKVEKYIEQSVLMKHRRAIVVDMPLHRHTKRHLQTVPVDFDKEKFDIVTKKRWNIYENEPIKDVAELFRVMRKLVNSDLSRLGEVLRLMEKHPKLIIFYNFDYELETLRTLGVTTGVEVREWNGHKHEDIPKADRWVYLVQYTAGAEGWNCIETDATVFYSLNYSYKIFEQAQGRIDRMNTPFVDLYYYILRSNSAIDNAIRKSLIAKENFNEKGYAKAYGLAA